MSNVKVVDRVEQENAARRALTWRFYLPDSDRSSGWSNHTYVLQLVVTSQGATPAAAWANARAEGLIPDEFLIEGKGELLSAIRDADEHLYIATEHNEEAAK